MGLGGIFADEKSVSTRGAKDYLNFVVNCGAHAARCHVVHIIWSEFYGFISPLSLLIIATACDVCCWPPRHFSGQPQQ